MFVGYSCEITDLDQLNNPNAVTVENAGLDLYWNAVQTSFAGWWYGNQTPMLQVARVACMTWGETYDNAYLSTSFNGSWNGVYSGLVPDIDAMIAAGAEAESWIHVGAGKILKGYALQMLVDKHGAIPYSEAWQGTANLSPAVDDAQTVYTAVKGLYDEAIADLGKTAIGAPGVDIYYGGDKAKWVTLANTLKFRLALNEGDAAGTDFSIPASSGSIAAVTNINESSATATINFTHHVDNVDELNKYVELTVALAGGESDATLASDGTQKQLIKLQDDDAQHAKRGDQPNPFWDLA